MPNVLDPLNLAGRWSINAPKLVQHGKLIKKNTYTCTDILNTLPPKSNMSPKNIFWRNQFPLGNFSFLVSYGITTVWDCTKVPVSGLESLWFKSLVSECWTRQSFRTLWCLKTSCWFFLGRYLLQLFTLKIKLALKELKANGVKPPDASKLVFKKQHASWTFATDLLICMWSMDKHVQIGLRLCGAVGKWTTCGVWTTFEVADNLLESTQNMIYDTHTHISYIYITCIYITHI